MGQIHEHSSTSEDVHSVISEWVDEELGYWERQPHAKHALLAEFDHLNHTIPSVLIIDIADGLVKIRPKPDIADSANRAFMTERGELYRSYLQEVIDRHGLTRNTSLAIDLNDISSVRSKVPVFSFQKQISSRNVLLPDVDFFYHDWYSQLYIDPQFDSKKPRAIFVGSTTGVQLVTTDIVLQAGSDRLRLAQEFIDSGYADIKIGAAVQYDSPETRQLIEAQAYFSGPISWEEQLGYKFLLSIDGNGATCSRVVNSLRSNSILAKFTSCHSLFYFKGLVPWKHYIPVSDQYDIVNIIKEEIRGVFDARPIIEEANRFASLYLSRESVVLYGALLIAKYASMLDRDNIQEPFKQSALDAVVAHLSNTGDVLLVGGKYCGGGFHRIEGVTLIGGTSTPPAAVWYRCVTAADNGEFVPLGVFSGTTGEARPIVRIDVRIDPEFADRYAFLGIAEFSDGAVVAIPETEGSCESGGAALVGLRIDVIKKA